MIAVTMIGFTTALSYVASAERRSRAFALLGIMGQFGLFAGIFVGEHLYDTFGFLALYLFTLFLYLSSLTLVQFFPESTFIHNYQEPKLSDFVAVFRQKAAYPVVFWIFILGSAFGTMVSFVPKIVLSAGLDFIKPFYIAFPLTVILVRATLSHFFDRFPKHRVLFLPLVLIPVSLYTVTFVTNYAILVLAGALYGMCHGVMFPVLLAYLLDYAPVNFRGRMNIIFQLFFNLGIFLSANIGGLIAEISVELTFRSMAIFTVSGIALLVFLQMRKRKLSAGT
jgi:MFS family permease